MATFPRTEADLIELVKRMASGLDEHRASFPNPPVSSSEIQAAYDEFLGVSRDAHAAAAAAKKRFAEKEALLQKLKDMMRANVRYAEGQTRRDPEMLTLIGWGARKRKGRPRAPGPVSGLEIMEEGADWVVLKWKKPRDGGAVGAYKVRMRVSNGDWELVESTANTEVRLANVERGVTLSFVVIAINKVGESIESSAVSTVLADRSSAVPWVPPRTVVREQV